MWPEPTMNNSQMNLLEEWQGLSSFLMLDLDSADGVVVVIKTHVVDYSLMHLLKTKCPNPASKPGSDAQKLRYWQNHIFALSARKDLVKQTT